MGPALATRETSLTAIGTGLRFLTHASLALFVVLSLTTPSWRYGSFTWWPLWEFHRLAGGPARIGLFNLLPMVVVLGWIIGRLLDYLNQSVRKWTWGRPVITLPLLGLTLLAVASLDPALTRRTFIHGGGLIITWLVYLYTINERPRLAPALAAVVLVQSAVGITQFALQRDLGLVALGELPLHPIFEGNTVLWARDRPWLRAYGLTAHPNLLGAILTTMLLLLWPLYNRCQGWRQLAIAAVMTVGLLGLLVSFSRAAWLGLAAGLSAWALLSGRFAGLTRRWRLNRSRRQSSPDEDGRRPPAWSLVKRLLPILPILLLLAINYDLVLSRIINLDTPSEARSLNQRLYDTRLALHIIGQHPWSGVGLGNYDDVAGAYDEEARRVHNVPLFVAAELGVPGALLWLCLALAPFWSRKTYTPAQLAPWAAMIVMSMFDTMLWWSSNWQTAVLFALLAANLNHTIPLYEYARSKLNGCEPYLKCNQTTAGPG